MSFRAKAILGIALIEAILLALLITSGLRMIRTLGADDLVSQARASSQLMSAMTKEALLATDLASLKSIADLVVQTPGVVYVRILGQDHVLASAGDAGALARPFVADKTYSDVTDSVFDIETPIATSQTRHGEIQMGFSTALLDNLLARARDKGAAIALFNIFITAVFSLILGVYLTRQLKALRDASQAVSNGQIGYQVPVHGHDELGQAAAAFNTMSLRISENLQSLESTLAAEQAATRQLKAQESDLIRQRKLLGAIAEVQSLFIRTSDAGALFPDILAMLVMLTDSRWGVIGEVVASGNAQPALNMHAVIDTAHGQPEQSIKLPAKVELADARNPFQRTVLDRVITLGASSDDVTQSTPLPGQPVLNSYLGVPLFAGGEMVGIVGLANCEAGYDETLAEYLGPLFKTIGQIMSAFQADNERETALAALQESQIRFRTILDTAVDSIITIDAQGLIDSFNPAAEKLFGYTSQEVKGRNVSMLMPEPFRGEHDGYLARYLGGGAPHVIGKGREIVALRKDGSTFAAELSVAEMTIGGSRHFSGIVRDISERRQREEQLQKTTALQSAILDSASYAIISTDADGTIRTFNAAAEQLTGYSSAEAIGQLNLATLQVAVKSANPNQATSAEQNKAAAEFSTLTAKARQGVVDDDESTWIRKDHSRVPMQVSLSRLLDNQGEVDGYLAIAMDITARKHDARQIRENELRKAALSEAALDCIVGMDIEGLIVEFNPAAERTFGYRFDEVVGRNLAEVIIPENLREAHHRGMKHYLATGEGPVIGKRIEVTARRSDGSLFPVELAVAVSQLEDRPFFTAYLRDISAQKLAQEKLQRYTSELNAIFNLSPDGFVAFDNAGRCTYVNPAFARMAGEERDIFVGATLDRFDTLLQSLADPALTWKSTFELSDGESQQLALVRPRPTIILCTMRQLELDDGKSLGRVLYLRDITHETEVDRMKSEFLSTAAHELRTPMASIHGFSELLLARKFDEATQRDLLDTIHRQSSNLVRLVNELLDLARIEARQGKDFRITSQPLAPIITRTVEGFNVPPGEYEFDMTLPDARLCVLADAEKLGQALLNLLSNAYKYSPQGGRISLSVLHKPDAVPPEVGIRVEDHGIGMTPEQLDHVFDRFYRADTSGAIPGTGLGMSLVKEITELMQGHVEITSNLGGGTRVSLWLPEGKAQDAGELA